MLLLTPTMLGSLLVGVALWLMFWYGVNHVDSIPYLKQYLSRKMILDWIRKNPQTALLITEGVNLLLHGIGSASAVFFNLGGTLVMQPPSWGSSRCRVCWEAIGRSASWSHLLLIPPDSSRLLLGSRRIWRLEHNRQT
jgi:hypothetical protein